MERQYSHKARLVKREKPIFCGKLGLAAGRPAVGQGFDDAPQSLRILGG